MSPDGNHGQHSIRHLHSVTATLIPHGHGLAFTTRDRPVRSARGWSIGPVRYGVSVVRSGRRYTLGHVFHDSAETAWEFATNPLGGLALAGDVLVEAGAAAGPHPSGRLGHHRQPSRMAQLAARLTEHEDWSPARTFGSASLDSPDTAALTGLGVLTGMRGVSRDGAP